MSDEHGYCKADKKQLAIFVKTKEENPNDIASDFRKEDTVQCNMTRHSHIYGYQKSDREKGQRTVDRSMIFCFASQYFFSHLLLPSTRKFLFTVNDDDDDDDDTH